jgi:hypothetical protein
MRQMRNYSREDEGIDHKKKKSLPKPLEIPQSQKQLKTEIGDEEVILTPPSEAGTTLPL